MKTNEDSAATEDLAEAAATLDASVPAAAAEADPEYDGFLARVIERFSANVAAAGDANAKPTPLFTTDAGGDLLWSAYIGALPEDMRPHHNCSACRRFINRYGNLVTIDRRGTTHSAIWADEDAPDLYKPAIAALFQLIRGASVTGVFLSPDGPFWGTPATGIWHHLAVQPPATMIFESKTSTAGQAMAAKREDFVTVKAALTLYTANVVATALTILKSEALYRSEAVLGQAKWLSELQQAVAASKRGNAAGKDNVIWRAVASAPAGFCHPRSSTVGTLFDDIASGLNFDDVSKRFAAKMHPLRYQRPKAAPSEGAIAAAEKLFKQMGAAASLARRFARPDEIQSIWRSKTSEESKPATGGGVFGHLKGTAADAGKAKAAAMGIPATAITWEKFFRKVLPDADTIEYYVPNTPTSFSALVTAVNAEAPPILQWDRVGKRNPVSWYLWVNGSLGSQFGLKMNAWEKVSAVTFKPSMWNEEVPGGHHGQGVFFVLERAKETRNAGAALFPSFLKSELHGVRSVIEAHSNGAQMEGMDGPQACGLMLEKGHSWDARFHVTSKGQTLEYKLDRWD